MITPVFRGYASKPDPKPRPGLMRRRAFKIFIGASVLEAVVLAGLAWAGGDLINRNCVASGGLLSCVTNWRYDDANGPAPAASVRVAPRDAGAQTEADARELKWRERCRPVIRQDQDGISRYHYAKPGCEFGKFED
jgi:hypothetical protein